MTLADALNRLYWRILQRRSLWHNRSYPFNYRIEGHSQSTGFIRYRGARVPYQCASALRLDSEEVNILCSGPSVQSIEYPKRLARRPLIAVNGSHLALEGGSRIQFYVVNDPGFVRNRTDLFRQGLSISEHVCLLHRAIVAALQIDTHIFDGVSLYPLDDVLYPLRKPKPSADELSRNGAIVEGNQVFSTNLARGVAGARTVAYVALQLAYALGVRRVFFFGLDLTDDGRFYHEVRPEASTIGDTYEQLIEPAFRLVKNRLVNENFRVFNCSLQSRLPEDIFPKLDPNLTLENPPAPIG